MPIDDPFMVSSNVETGDDPGGEAQAALGGALAGGGQPAAAASAPAAAPAAGAGAGPGGGYDPLAGLSQLMGSLNQLPGPQQPPAGAQISQRHGGLLTGLAGVLLDGLAGGMAPTAQEAFQRPMQRQQQQMQIEEMKLRQQQAQQEMAMAPIKAKAQMAQAAINILQAGHMMRELGKEHQIDMLGAQGTYMKSAIDEGRARLDATAPDLKAAQARTQELQAQNKDTALNYGYYPTKWDEQGNATEYGIYESYPHGTLQKAFHYEFAGDEAMGIKPETVDLPAGMQESEARLRLSAVANEHSTAMRLATERIQNERLAQQIKFQGQEIGLRARQVSLEEKKQAMAGDPATITNLGREIVEGNVDPSQVGKPGTRTGTGAAIFEAAQQYSQTAYGKPFDWAKAQSDYNYAKNTQVQSTMKYLNSLVGPDNKSGNLQHLVDASQKIPLTTRFPALNDATRWAELQVGMSGVAGYRAVITETADQVAKILQGGGTGSGTSDAKLQQAQELFQKGFNGQQMADVANELRTLLGNRKIAMIGDNIYLRKWYGMTGAPGAGAGGGGGGGGGGGAANEAAQFGGVPR